MTAEVFNYVAREKRQYRTLLPNQNYDDQAWLPLKALDVKVGDWEPIDDSLSHVERYLLVCRVVAEFPQTLETRIVTANGKHLGDDYRYERALASVGLWDPEELL